jgi:predicted nucleic acid-binding protein
MTMPVCVDASFLLKLVLDEAQSDEARSLWHMWLETGLDVLAPSHLLYEATSVLRNHVYRGLISAEAGDAAYRALVAQEIQLIEPDIICDRAWEFASHFARPTACDSFYLAVGELAGCDLWTADRRLYGSVHAELGWVRLIGA